MEIQRSEALHRPHPLSIHTCFRYQQPPNEKLVDLILTGSISRRSLVIAYYHVAVGWPLSTGQQLRGVFVSVSHREACLYCLEPTRRTEYLRIHSGAAFVMSMADSLEFEVPSGPPPLLSSEQLDALCDQGYLALQLPPHLGELYDTLFSSISDFFDLPLEQKTATYPSLPGDTEQGYSFLPDEKEFLTIRHRLHTLPADQDAGGHDSRSSQAVLLAALEQAWEDTARLLHRILGDISTQLPISPHAWDTVVTDSLTLQETRDEATPTLLRLFRYMPRGGVSEPHRDLGLLTLCVCRGRGLQVLDKKAGGWQDAPEATLLVGDTLRVLSGNRIPAALHQVEATESGRQSIVFALRASTKGNIDLTDFAGQGVVEAKALWDAIRKKRVNVNLHKDARDEMRARVKKADMEGSIA